MPPSSPSPDPISDRIMSLFTTIDRPGILVIMSTLLIKFYRTATKKNSSIPFRIRIFLFLSYSFKIETINTFIVSISISSLENITRL